MPVPCLMYLESSRGLPSSYPTVMKNKCGRFDYRKREHVNLRCGFLHGESIISIIIIVIIIIVIIFIQKISPPDLLQRCRTPIQEKMNKLLAIDQHVVTKHFVYLLDLIWFNGLCLHMINLYLANIEFHSTVLFFCRSTGKTKGDKYLLLDNQHISQFTSFIV